MVTGATSGIGEATSLSLAQQGATTIVVGRNQKKCEKTVNKIQKITGNSFVSYMLADLSSQKDIQKLSDQFKNYHHQLDVLINNAGAKFVSRLETIDGYRKELGITDMEQWYQGQVKFLEVHKWQTRSAAKLFDEQQIQNKFNALHAIGQLDN